MRANNARFTVHAICGADRLVHGVRIVDDIEVLPDGSAGLGRLASIVRDKRIPLEMCPSIDKHPFDLFGLRFQGEMPRLVEAFGYGWTELERFTINAMTSAFIQIMSAGSQDDQSGLSMRARASRCRSEGRLFLGPFGSQ